MQDNIQTKTTTKSLKNVFPQFETEMNVYKKKSKNKNQLLWTSQDEITYIKNWYWEYVKFKCGNNIVMYINLWKSHGKLENYYKVAVFFRFYEMYGAQYILIFHL